MTSFETKTPLGKTGLSVSRLGIGSSFGAPTRVIEEAVEQGINYLYWGTVRRPAFGRAMRNVARRDRDGVVLTIQSYARVAALVAPSVEISLRRVGVDYFDLLLLGNWNQPPSPAVVDAALALKDQGKVRFLMVSTHNRPLLPSLFEGYAKGESPFDVFMFRYNAVHRGAEKDAFPFLPAEQKPGIVTYTTTRWGDLLDPRKMPEGESPPPASHCYRFALSNPAVDIALCGPANRDQMQEAIRSLELGPLSPDEMSRMQSIGHHLYGHHKARFADAGDEPS
jgi:aryl-alcohol dehydrogenase-like predicted oxidoreductase